MNATDDYRPRPPTRFATARSILIGLGILVVVVLGIRLGVIVQRTEIGWECMVLQWQDSTMGWLGLKHRPIDTRDPSEQADFWLREVERVQADDPESAEVAMGSAWVLDTPGIRFMNNYVKQSNHASSFPRFGMTLDYDAIRVAKAEFQNKCSDRCLLLAARATELEPNDVRWWRMRALLLFGEDDEPRSDDWLEILEACGRHDPDNALYDYLAAQQLWSEAAEYDMSFDNDAMHGKWQLKVDDAELFQQGLDYFKRGQTKSQLAIGEMGYPCVTDFLSRSQVRKTDQAEVAVSRLVTYRHSMLFYGLWRWQDVRAADAEQSGEATEQLKIHKESLRLFDQAIAPEETSALGKLIHFFSVRQDVYDSIVSLAEDNPQLLSKDELAVLESRHEELQAESEITVSALQELSAVRDEQHGTLKLSSILSAVAVISAASLLLFSGAVFVMARLLAKKRGQGERLGMIRQIAAWAMGCLGTFVLLGMAPAEMISYEIQAWIITGVAWAVALAIAAMVVWQVFRLLKRRRFQISLISLFYLIFGVAILAAMWPLLRLALATLADNPPELWLHPRGWGKLDAEVLRHALKTDRGTWLWAAIQWFAYNGVYVGLASSLVMIGIWFARRSAKASGESVLRYYRHSIRSRGSHLLRCVASSALAMATCWLIVYLATVPETIRASESQFQYKMQYCRTPELHWDEIQSARARIRESGKR